MHPNLFPAYFIFFIISVHVHTSLCAENEQYLNCSTPVQCANMEISYPFWGGNRPGYCGHPGFELSCDGDAPEFTMVEVSYRVRDINNASQTLTVARADFWNDYCPQKYINTTLNVTLFSYSTRYPRLTLYYGCPPSIQGLPHAFICSSGTTNITGYLATNDTTLVTCNNSVTVPVSQSAVDAIENSNGSSSLLTAALNNGFGLVWAANNSLCQRCVASGGQCGYKSSTNEFTCYCRDKPYAFTYPFILASQAKQTLVFWKKETEDNQNVETFIRNYGSLGPKRYKYSVVKKMTNSFTCKLGQGEFGCVYQGKLPDGRQVAVKLLSESKGNGKSLLMNHPVGFCFEGTRRALIYEFMPNGSLDKLIYQKGSPNANLKLEWKTMYQIAVGIARGLEYLYRGCNTRILHFDIKPHNILLDEDFCPKISDFGLAKLCQRKESMVSMAHARGTAGYIAPEVFCRNFGGVSHKSDVYSYGMLVLEMIGGRKNIDAQVSHTSQIYFPTWIYKQLQPGEDLILHSITNEEEEEMARKMVLVSLWCIQLNPSDRPSIDKVVEMLEGSLQSLEIPQILSCFLLKMQHKILPHHLRK
ncbi:hypothetical protein AAG906_013408 [Vitis piasezkii]